MKRVRLKKRRILPQSETRPARPRTRPITLTDRVRAGGLFLSEFVDESGYTTWKGYMVTAFQPPHPALNFNSVYPMVAVSEEAEQIVIWTSYCGTAVVHDFDADCNPAEHTDHGKGKKHRRP